MLGPIVFWLIIIALMIWCGHVTAGFAAARGRSGRA